MKLSQEKRLLFSEADLQGNTLRTLLPPAEALIPISPANTFGECGYNSGNFASLSLQKKLEVVMEVVRQANLINYAPTPETEASLSGDCTTVAKALADYASYLGMEGEFQVASVRKLPHESDWRRSSRHVVVLHSLNNIFRTIDPTAMVGYGYGTVGPECRYVNGKLYALDGSTPVYEDVTPLSKSDLELITKINTVRNDFYFKNLPMDMDVVKQLYNSCREVGEHMNSWVSELAFMLGSLETMKNDAYMARRYLAEMVERDPLKPKALGLGLSQDDRNKIVEIYNDYSAVAARMGGLWKDRASWAWGEGRYPEAIELAQWSFRELNNANMPVVNMPDVLTQSGSSLKMYNLNPRRIADLNLVGVWIKPSAKIVGVAGEIKKSMLCGREPLLEFVMDLTTILNISENGRFPYIPLVGSHPHGIYTGNWKAYTGPSEVYLVEGNRYELGQKKRTLRNLFLERNPEIDGKTFFWFNGEKVNWNRGITNLVHSTDSAAETVVHTLLPYPEASLVHRWKYPHPLL